MVWKSALRYARVWLVLALASGQLIAQQKEEILELHNRYRAMVSPEAADMLHMLDVEGSSAVSMLEKSSSFTSDCSRALTLETPSRTVTETSPLQKHRPYRTINNYTLAKTWNETLSAVAQGYAAQCIWEHNYEVMNTLGENLFLTTGPLIISKSMANWFDEHRQYDYATDSCESDMCGHYTQMVWAKSNGVGCASHFCQTVEKLHYENATFLVCNYFPQGNTEGVKPYEAGSPCSRCPQEASECVEKTCAAQMKGTTEEWITDTWLTETPQTEPVGSAIFTRCSVATLLLSGLMLSFMF